MRHILRISLVGGLLHRDDRAPLLGRLGRALRTIALRTLLRGLAIGGEPVVEVLGRERHAATLGGRRRWRDQCRRWCRRCTRRGRRRRLGRRRCRRWRRRRSRRRRRRKRSPSWPFGGRRKRERTRGRLRQLQRRARTKAQLLLCCELRLCELLRGLLLIEDGWRSVRCKLRATIERLICVRANAREWCSGKIAEGCRRARNDGRRHRDAADHTWRESCTPVRHGTHGRRARGARVRGRRAPARAAVRAVRASAVRVGERAIRGRRRRGGQIGLGHVRRDGAEGIVRESATILPPQARAWRGDRRRHLVRHDSIYTRDTQAGKRVRSHQTGHSPPTGPRTPARRPITLSSPASGIAHRGLR